MSNEHAKNSFRKRKSARRGTRNRTKRHICNHEIVFRRPRFSSYFSSSFITTILLCSSLISYRKRTTKLEHLMSDYMRRIQLMAFRMNEPLISAVFISMIVFFFPIEVNKISDFLLYGTLEK